MSFQPLLLPAPLQCLFTQNPLVIVKHLMLHPAPLGEGAESRPSGQRAPWGAGEAVNSSDQNRGMELVCQFFNGSPWIWADYLAELLQALRYAVHGNLGETLCCQDQVLSSVDCEFRLKLNCHFCWIWLIIVKSMSQAHQGRNWGVDFECFFFKWKTNSSEAKSYKLFLILFVFIPFLAWEKKMAG